MLGFGPISADPVSAQFQWRAFIYASAEVITEVLVTKIFAATMPFITRAADTPANQPFDGTLSGAIRIDRSIASNSGGYSGFSEAISEISLINSSGIYDSLAGAVSINGQEVICSVGEYTGRDVVDPYASFAVFANLRAERMLISRQSVRIELRDPSLTLSEETVQQGVYGGGGGIDGGEEIKGKRKPYGDGVVFNASPVLVIGAESVWQCNDGPVAQITAVKDGGVKLTFAFDVATLTNLRGASVSPGEYATCNAEGYFRLGGASFKQITVDFTGLRLTTADIIRNVAINSAHLSASQINEDSFNALNEDQSAIIGYYLNQDSSETCADMFTKLMRGIGGWHGMNVDGKLEVNIFTEPGDIAEIYYNTMGGNLIDIDRAPLPDGTDPPPHRRRVTWARNWTVMTDLFGEVSADDPALAEYLTQPFKVASTSEASSALVIADYPNAPDFDPIDAYFNYEADALAEAERIFDLYFSGFSAYHLRVKNAMFMHQIGQTIMATDNRLGLDEGKLLRLVEIIDDTESGITELIGFG